MGVSSILLSGGVRIAFIYYLLYGSLLVHCHHVVNKGRRLSPSAGCSSCCLHTSHLGLKGWNDQTQGCDVVRYGLEGERMTAMARRFPDGWDDFAAGIIKTDEDLQRVKEKKRLAKKGTSSSSNTAPKTRKPDISKYKLLEEERKEYLEQGLCFKCHKKGPISKYCKGERMVYK